MNYYHHLMAINQSIYPLILIYLQTVELTHISNWWDGGWVSRVLFCFPIKCIIETCFLQKVKWNRTFANELFCWTSYPGLSTADSLSCLFSSETQNKGEMNGSRNKSKTKPKKRKKEKSPESVQRVCVHSNKPKESL